MPAPLPGVVLLDKPEGQSSFAALNETKRLLGTRKVGHTGTLDPMASGLLVALTGPATRCARYFTGLDKVYAGEITFGTQTDTDDRIGKIIRREPPPPMDAVSEIAREFVGTMDQIPPAYSAVHVDGERAYRRAREGESVDIPARRVTIRSLELEILDRERISMRVSCSSGTYIRSLARDLGVRLGSVAHLSALRRLEVGPFSVDEASEQSAGQPVTLPLVSTLLRLPTFVLLDLESEEARLMANGGRVQLGDRPAEPDAGHVVAVHRGTAVAIGNWQGGEFHYDMVFPAERPEVSHGAAEPADD